MPWRRAWQPAPVFLPGESHGQKSLVGYSPWARKESDTTEASEYTTTQCPMNSEETASVNIVLRVHSLSPCLFSPGLSVYHCQADGPFYLVSRGSEMPVWDRSCQKVVALGLRVMA